jgi:DNA polymerase sigma
MNFFKNIKTIDKLKIEYHRLAMENHPDHGGDNETMKEINVEFDLAFRILEKKAPEKSTDTKQETASDFRNYFYTENGWAGSRFNPNLPLRDIALMVRRYVKEVYPTWKFSVRTEYYSGGCSLHVALTEAPENIFIDSRVKEAALSKRRLYGSDEEAIKCCQETVTSGYISNWDCYYKWMSDKAVTVLEDVENLVNSYRYNDSDSMIDYFDTNFYPFFDIGKWDKPLKIVQRMDRFQTYEGNKKPRG